MTTTRKVNVAVFLLLLAAAWLPAAPVGSHPREASTDGAGVAGARPGTGGPGTRAAEVEIVLDSHRWNGTPDTVSGNTVNITGTLICPASSVPLTVVELTARSELGWDAVVSETRFEFDLRGGEEAIEVQVEIPPETPPFTVDRIAVGGTATSGGSTTELQEAESEVEAGQFFRLSARAGVSRLNLTSGGEVSIGFNVTNGGNGDDLVEAELEERAEMVARGWSVGIEPGSVTLGPGDTWEVRLTVRAPEGTGGWQVMTMRANSSGVDPATGERGAGTAQVRVWVSNGTQVDGEDGGGGDGADGEGGDPSADGSGTGGITGTLRAVGAGLILFVILSVIALAAVGSVRGHRGEGRGGGRKGRPGRGGKAGEGYMSGGEEGFEVEELEQE